jgi:hypothetical protein
MSDEKSQCSDSTRTNFETQTRVWSQTQVIESVESVLNLYLSFY